MRVMGRILGLAVVAGIGLAPIAQANPNFVDPSKISDRGDQGIVILVLGVLTGAALIGIAYLRRRRWKRAYLRGRYKERHPGPPGP